MEKTLEILSREKENPINKTIENVLTEVFGTKAALCIYKYIEDNYNVGKNEISENIDIFTKDLEECLSTGAFLIETKIINDLYNFSHSF
jgi:hypothetical protein